MDDPDNFNGSALQRVAKARFLAHQAPNADFSTAIRLSSAESPDFTNCRMTNIAQPFLNLRVRKKMAPHAVPDKPEAHFDCSA